MILGTFINLSKKFASFFTVWLAIANEVRTRIISLNRDIFIPETNYYRL